MGSFFYEELLNHTFMITFIKIYLNLAFHVVNNSQNLYVLKNKKKKKNNFNIVSYNDYWM